MLLKSIVFAAFWMDPDGIFIARPRGRARLCRKELSERVSLDADTDTIIVEFTDRPRKESFRLTENPFWEDDDFFALVDGEDLFLDEGMDRLIREIMRKHRKKAIYATIYEVYEE